MRKRKIIFICLFISLYSLIFSENYTIFKANGKYGLMDTDLNIVLNPIYDRITAKSNDFYIAVVFSHFSYTSYIIKDLKVIYTEEGQGFEQIYKNLFVKVKAEKYGLNGKILFDCFTGKDIYNDWGVYETAFPIIPIRGEDFYYYIDNSGNILQKLKGYEKAFGFYENIAIVMSADRKYSVIDKNGNKKFPYKIKDCYQRYSEGLMAAIMENGSSGFIDYNGTIKIPKIFYFVDGEFAATEFSNGFACVKSSDMGQEWEIIDNKGNVISHFNSLDIPTKFHDGFCLTTIIQQGEKKWGYISTSGKLLANRYFDYADDFLHGWAYILIDGKDAVINTSGEISLVVDLKNDIKAQSYSNK